MKTFSLILADLRAVIAARAARDRTLTVLLVAVWGRIARMGNRLERLIALWRAGKLPKARAARARAAGRDCAPRATPTVRFPTTPGWLRQTLGYEVGACGSQLQHLLTEAECQAFLAAVPQAGRILRPLLRMLTSDPLPAVVRGVQPVIALPSSDATRTGMVISPGSQILDV